MEEDLQVLKPEPPLLQPLHRLKARRDTMPSFSVARLGLFKHRPDLFGQFFRGKRFLDEECALIQDAVVNDGVSRVAGHEQILEARMACEQFGREVAAQYATADVRFLTRRCGADSAARLS